MAIVVGHENKLLNLSNSVVISSTSYYAYKFLEYWSVTRLEIKKKVNAKEMNS